MHESLEDHLEAAHDAGIENADESGMFAIVDLDRADWAVRKLARRRRKFADAEQVAAAEIARVTAWLNDQRRRHEADTAFLTSLLEAFHRRMLDEDPKAKTVRLPAGELVARKAPDKLVTDPETFIAWAKEHELTALIRVKEDVDAKTAKVRLGMSADEPDDEGRVRAIDPTTGVVVDGAWFVPGQVGFTVRTADEAETSVAEQLTQMAVVK
jgi:phage host-nuclease inhibitor protein Gam